MSSLSSEEVPSTNVGSCSDTNRTSKSGSDMFVNTVSLAPMVRAGSLPFRTLCLKYGADLVWGEEIIDKRILKCTRVVNERLSTIDYNVVGERGKGNVDVLIFRTCSAEEGKVIFQLGTSCPDRALAAAQVVESDVAAIDINMGCPKKFSVQGGMGAALLSNQDNACNIISNLSKNLSIPVTAKIRILDSIETTADFMKRLEAAGAAAITVHLRTKKHASQEPAQLDVMGALASSVNIPVIANGDIYTCADLRSVMNFSPRGAAGAMLGRPLLLNPSLLCHLRLRDTIHNCTSSEQSKVDLESSCLPIRTVVQDFLHECIRYEPPFQIIKYTIQEMNSQRRHRQEKLESLKDNGLFFGRLPEYVALSAAGSLSELCKLFDIDLPSNVVDIKSTKRTITEMRRKSEGGPENESVSKKNKTKAVSPKKVDVNGVGEKLTEEENSDLQSESIALQLPATDLRCEDSYFEGEEVTFLTK